MHAHSLDRFTHEHVFLGARHERNERRVWLVVGLTSAMMVAEITGGTMFGSLALVADGWHMSTHAAALSISALAYLYARRHARDPRFAFGTGKLGDLAGFASAIVLAMIALLIGYESVTRLVHPVPALIGIRGGRAKGDDRGAGRLRRGIPVSRGAAHAYADPGEPIVPDR